jgi:CelD/BcsL family acetyltransferase involved in cellulose biosynthesis
VIDFFLSEGWARCWLETLGGDAEAYSLELPGAPPMLLAGRRREGFRVLRPAGGDIADYEELPLGEQAGGDALVVLEGVLEDVRCDTFMLAHVPAGSATFAWARRLQEDTGHKRMLIFPRGEAFEVELAHSWEEQQSRFRKKLVADTNRCERRLGEELGELEVERVTESDAIAATVDFIAHHHRRRHNSLGRYSFFERPEVRAFYGALAQRCANDERLHVTRLKAGGRVTAAHLGFDSQDRFLYYLPTFDGELSRYSPGRVLAFWLVRDAIERRRAVFDLGLGDEPYKREFGPREVAQHSILLTARGPRGRAAGAWFASVRPRVGRRLQRAAPLLHRVGLLREMS